MAAIREFEEMEVWQAARQFVKTIYAATNSGSFSRDIALKSQLQRAAISILSNIAEGFERKGNKEFSHFLFISKGSAGEARAQLGVARDLGYLNDEQFERLNSSIGSIARQLSGLIKYLNRTITKGTGKQCDNLTI